MFVGAEFNKPFGGHSLIETSGGKPTARQSDGFKISKGWGVWAPFWQPHSLMILPQVHLRKPCYDFYFL